MSQPLVRIVNPALVAQGGDGIVAYVGPQPGATVAFVPYSATPVPGSIWYYQGNPYSDPVDIPSPNNGDTFVYTDTWAVFSYYDGLWVYQGVLQGPQGAPGTPLTTSYQVVNASSWSTEHTYPYMPAVRLIDSATQADVAASIDYPTPTSVHINFPQSWTGTVYLT